MKKIIFISYVPFTDEYEKNFYFPEMTAAGYAVEYWDISRVYFKDYVFERGNDRDFVRKFPAFEDLARAISGQDVNNTVYIPLIIFTGKVLNLFRLFRRCHCRTAFYARGLLPVASENRSPVDKLSSYLSHLRDPETLLDAIGAKAAPLLKALGYINEYDLVFTAGHVADGIYRCRAKTIKVNYWDYDNYLRVRDDGDRIVHGEYCVFIDDNLVKADDNQILGKRPIDGAGYYASLNRFFDHIEKKFRVKVVVAGNPFSAHGSAEFAGREVHKRKTNELIKDCAFVMAHYSSSIAYPVLYNKPVVFIYTDQIKSQFYFKFISCFAQYLKSRLVNIDSVAERDALTIEKPDEQAYARYKYNYLTNEETESRLTADIVIEQLGRFFP